jgi:hypothetical protein
MGRWKEPGFAASDLHLQMRRRWAVAQLKPGFGSSSGMFIRRRLWSGGWPTSVGTVETLGTTCCSYLHKDWLGNSRIVSSTSNNTVTADQAYTPYGEIYNIFGANNGSYQVFAGMIADLAPSTTTPIMWDTPNRELSYTGRWLSPALRAGCVRSQQFAVLEPLCLRLKQSCQQHRPDRAVLRVLW